MSPSLLPAEILARVRQIEIITRKRVDDVMTGQYKSHFKGQGVTFSEHRQYMPGDDIRHLDWKVSARTRDPMIKKFEEERELTVLLVVDISGSQAFGSSEKLKSEVAAEVAGMISYAAIHGGDKVGALLFAGDVELILPPRKGRSHLQRVIREILVHEAKTPGTNLTQALQSASRILKHASIVFVISDFMAEGYEIALRQLARKHDVVALNLSDRREDLVPDLGWVYFQDPETGEEVGVDTGGYEFKRWLEQTREEQETDRRTAFKGGGIDELRIQTHEDYVQAIVKFFRLRALRRSGR